MKHYLLFVLSFIFITTLSGQSNIKFCDHEIDPSYKEHVQALQAIQNEDCNLGMTSIPIALTFLMKSDSTSGYYEGLENKIMDSLTAHFIPTGIHLYLVAPPVFIYEDLVYDFVIDENVEYIHPGIKSNRVNVVVANSVSYQSGATVCGLAKAYPNTVLIRYSCVESNTISHEVGHEFSLAHTHHTQFGVELVDGSNCETAGDLICDTPADPNRIDLCNTNCIWRGTYEDENGYDIYLLDANGDKYNPDVNNIMSYYGTFGCRRHFSYQQSLVMHHRIAEKITAYGYQTPKMHFEIYDRAEICDLGYSASVKVSDVDPFVTYQWDMDSDGIIDYHGPKAQHIYPEYGNYTIKLIMTYADGHQFYQSKVCAINYTNNYITAPFLDDYNTLLERNYVKLIEQTNFKWNLKLHVANQRIVAGDQVHINENSTMEYKVNLGAIEQPLLEFEYNSNTNAPIGGDTLLVELFNCDETPMVLFEKWGQNLGTDGEYQWVSIPIPTVDTDIAQIRFTTKGDPENWHEIYIDNFQIIEGEISNTHQLTKESIKIYPNPTSDLIQIQSELVISKIDVVNMFGQVISTTHLSTSVDLSQVPTGIYFLKIYSGKQSYLKKVIKTN